MTEGARASKCRTPLCQEHAISFSEHCWEHTNRVTYLSNLPSNLARLHGRQTQLNLKKVHADHLDFSHLDLKGSSFSQAHITHSHFIGSNLSHADFIGAHFESCDFIGSQLLRVNAARAYFRHVTFSHSSMRGTNFTEALFEDVDFMGSHLFNTTLWNSDLTGAKHLKKKNFNNPRFRQGTTEGSLSEKNKLTAYESYRALKHYFYRNGLYEDASWAAYRELTMQRRHYFETRNPRYLASLFMDILSGYTEKPNRVILSSFFIILIFATVYYLCNVPMMTVSDQSARIGFWDSLYFSFITFTTVGFGNLVPRPNTLFRILTCLEAFSGPFMSGLYVFTLTRRYAVS